LFDEMTTGAPASEPTKVKYSAAEAPVRARTGYASDWRTWLAGALILLAIGYVWYSRRQAAEASAAAKVVRPSIPVSAAKAQTGNLNIYLSAIGAVTPFNTTTVKSRVDGAIQEINYKEGQTVKAGDLLIQIDPRPYQVQLAQADGQMAKDQATFEDARLTYERDQELYSEGVLARQTLDDQQSLMNQARGAVATDQGAIASAKLNITYSKITAPITGRIGLRMLDLGNIVHATDTTGLAVITQLQPISVIFAIPEDDIPQVAKRMQGGQALPVEAWDREFKKKIASGTLLTFDNEIDPTTGTVKLKASFDNPDFALFPSQFVNARLLINTIENTVLIPTAAVQKSPQGTYVYVIKPDNTVAQRGITVGATQGDLSSIKTGLADGETVVTDGVDKLQPGVKVSARMTAVALSDHPTTAQ
jgi:multidrug efflux system membrane fusion protein